MWSAWPSQPSVNHNYLKSLDAIFGRALTMGQTLSLPMIVIGLALLIRSARNTVSLQN